VCDEKKSFGASLPFQRVQRIAGLGASATSRFLLPQPCFHVQGSGSRANWPSDDILGNVLTGATAVKFGSVPATSFKVVSSTFMTAVVPPTATTGPLSVTTPTGTVSTLRSLKISPTVTEFTIPRGTGSSTANFTVN